MEGERERQPIAIIQLLFPSLAPSTNHKQKKNPFSGTSQGESLIPEVSHPQGSFLNSKPGWYSKHQSTFTLQGKLTHCAIKKRGGETAAQPIKSRVCMACHLFIT
jgi:hypothetical protein